MGFDLCMHAHVLFGRHFGSSPFGIVGGVEATVRRQRVSRIHASPRANNVEMPNAEIHNGRDCVKGDLGTHGRPKSAADRRTPASVCVCDGASCGGGFPRGGVSHHETNVPACSQQPSHGLTRGG